MMNVATWPAPAASRAYGIVEFRAMASPCRIIADTVDLARSGRQLVRELEARWSRFLPTSEVSALNRAAGRLTVVSDRTFLLLQRAESARRRTDGLFEPFVLDRLEEIERRAGAAHDPIGLGVEPTLAGPIDADSIVLIDGVSAVRLPAGVRFDPGGIGKGLAADLVVERLLDAGSNTVQVELGGDVRVAGENWTGGPWDVIVRDPFDRATPISTVSIAQGAVATSSPHGRTWQVGGERLHHLIDPRTGRSADTDVRFATATSSELWWAEIVAKVAVLVGSTEAPGRMRELGGAGLIATDDGVIVPVPSSESRPVLAGDRS